MDVEKAFERFLENPAYDEAEAALFTVVRKAYLAGWEAAGGKIAPEPIIILPRSGDDK